MALPAPRDPWLSRRSQLEYGEQLRAQIESSKGAKASPQTKEAHQGLLVNNRQRQNPVELAAPAYGEVLRAQMEDEQKRKAAERQQKAGESEQGLLVNNRQRQNPAAYAEELRSQMEEEQQRRALERQNKGRDAEPGPLQGHQPLLVNNRQRQNPTAYAEELRAQMEEDQRKKAMKRHQKRGEEREQGLLVNPQQKQNHTAYADELRAQMEEDQQRKAMRRQNKEMGSEAGHQNMLVNNRQKQNPAAYAEELRAQMEEAARKKATERQQRRDTAPAQNLLIDKPPTQSAALGYGEALRLQMKEQHQTKMQVQREQRESQQPETMHHTDQQGPKKQQAPQVQQQQQQQHTQQQQQQQQQQQPAPTNRHQPQPRMSQAQREVGPADARFGEALRMHVEQRREQARELTLHPDPAARRSRRVARDLAPSEAGAACGDTSEPLQQLLAEIADQATGTNLVYGTTTVPETRSMVEQEAVSTINTGHGSIEALKSFLRALAVPSPLSSYASAPQSPLMRKITPAMAASVLDLCEQDITANNIDAQSDGSGAESALSLPPLPRQTDLRDPRKAVEHLRRTASLPVTPSHARLARFQFGPGARRLPATGRDIRGALPPATQLELEALWPHLTGTQHGPRQTPAGPRSPALVTRSDPTSRRPSQLRLDPRPPASASQSRAGSEPHTSRTRDSETRTVSGSRPPSPSPSPGLIRADNLNVPVEAGDRVVAVRLPSLHQIGHPALLAGARPSNSKAPGQGGGNLNSNATRSYPEAFVRKQANYASTQPLWEPVAERESAHAGVGVGVGVGTARTGTVGGIIETEGPGPTGRPLGRDELVARRQATFQSSGPLWELEATASEDCKAAEMKRKSEQMVACAVRGVEHDQPSDKQSMLARKQAMYKSSQPLWEASEDYKMERKGQQMAVATATDQPYDKKALFAKKQANFVPTQPLWEASADSKMERKSVLHDVGVGPSDQPLDKETMFAKKQANFKSSGPLW